MIIKDTFLVKEETVNTRIDKWIKSNIVKLPQSFIEKSLRFGKIKVNNKKIKSSYKLQINDKIILSIQYEKKSEVKKFSYNANIHEYNDIKKHIIFENSDYMVFNKPSGISVQSGTKSPKNIIDILNKFSEQKKYYLVHRIDKETSGLIIFACNKSFAQDLSSQFRNKVIKKNYLAILHGSLSQNEGVLIHDLSIKENNRLKTFKAETSFFIISKNRNFSYVQASPITGRKHQIRQQFYKIYNPIVGDNKFFIPHFKNENNFLMLHSYEITFLYKKKKKVFKIDPPIEFKKFLTKINL